MSQISHAAVFGFDPYSSVPSGDVGWFGSKALKSVKRAVKSGVKYAKKAARVVAPIVDAAAPAILEQMKKSSPWGSVAAAAYNGMKAGIQGRNFQHILEASARGALPAEIQAALDVASDAVRGKNILRSALANAGKVLKPGSPEAQGFGLAQGVLTGSGTPTVTQLATLRRGLDTEGAKRAFDAAVGTAAKAAQAVKAAPKLAAVPYAIANRGVTRPGSTMFRALNPRAADLIANRVRSVSVAALRGRADTAGLESNATIYRAESGDSPWKIAVKLVNSGNRWPELVAANPKKPRVKEGANKGSFATLFAGEALKLPASWTAKHASTLTADSLAQARAILKVWSETDGKNEAGVTDYGAKPSDSGLTWGPRDRLMMVSFLGWTNRKTGKNLPTAGDLNDKNADELRLWAANHAAQPSPAAANDAPVPAPGVPPTVPTQPAGPTYGGDPITYAPDVVTPTGTLYVDTIPADVKAVIEGAMRSKSPAQIRAVANQVRNQGREAAAEGPGFAAYSVALAKAASDLDLLADKLEASQMGVPDPRPNEQPQVIPMVVPGTVAPKAAAKSDDGLLWLGGAAAALKVFNLI
jgi:hypothetical protein